MNVFRTAEDLQSACGDDPGWLCESVFDLTGGNELLASTAERIVTIALIAFGAWFVALLARRYLARAVAKVVAPDRAAPGRQLARLGEIGEFAGSIVPDEGPDPRREARLESITSVVSSTATIVIWAVALLMMLGEVGVNLAPLIAGAGIAGVALGFGAQSLVKDCIAGLFMLLEDQYGIGDIVDLDEAIGTVEKISLRTTVLRGIDGTVWHVPNGEVRRVGNQSQLWSVALVDVDVAYDCDLAAAREIITERAVAVCEHRDWSDAVLEAPTLLGVEALGADGITIRLTVKTQPGTQWALQRALREEIKGALDDAGVEIPFPQRTIWIRHDDGPSEP